jgi:hypothetical protein
MAQAGTDTFTAMNRKQAVQIVGLATSLTLALTAALLLLAATALAAPAGLNWGTQVNAGQCATHGSPVVDVNYKVVAAVDSGFGGYWASEDYNKRAQVWDEGKGVYCAVVSYHGQFTGVAGQQSPDNTEALSGNERGTFQGGYRAEITGELLTKPTWPTHGQVGTIDYECTTPVGFKVSCPGSVDWISQYFDSSYGFEYDWWGWIYHGGRYGTWVNSSDGNAGNIS